MSLWDEVSEAYESAVDTVSDYWSAGADKVEDVKEYFFSDEDTQADEVSGLPGAPSDGVSQPGSGGINWLAVSTLVGAVGIAARFIR